MFSVKILMKQVSKVLILLYFQEETMIMLYISTPYDDDSNMLLYFALWKNGYLNKLNFK